MSASREPASTGPAFLGDALRRALGDPGLRVLASEPVSGGCIHHALKLTTTRGEWFAKWNSDCAPDLFKSEAAGLRALREAASSLAVPEVLVASTPGASHPAFIVMEYLAPGRAGARDEAALGRGLAVIHARSGDRFGFPVTTYCGPTPQVNDEADTWAEFYGERRLRPLSQRLEAEGRIGGAERRLVERVVERLPALVPPATLPSLVHGDLWSGNVLATTRGPGLVDPAAAYCDREMEFGITTLFGGFRERFFDAYDEAWPLPPGWRERNPLYQLYHLLNHHLIFGGHYGSEALSIARRFA